MCGIYGIWHTDRRPVDIQMLQQATTEQRHRGPDDEGYLLADTGSGHLRLAGGPDTDPRLGLPTLQMLRSEQASFDLALGFRRLAILDLSPNGHQPMCGENQNFWIVFNGEVYNYLELRDELTRCGHAFRTGTDTEVILAAYEEWGIDCLARFNGMWAIAIWDRQDRSLFLARDRFGVKPLFFARTADTFTFASEIKALVGKHGIAFQPEERAIYRFLTEGLLPSPSGGETFFRGIQSLPPGQWMRVKSNAIQQGSFWSLPSTTEGHAPRDPERIVAQYRDLFVDSVRLRLRADVPIGTCLSGGLDSSSIVSTIGRLIVEGGVTTEQIGQKQKTFSSVYETPGRYNERHYIERVLQTTGAEKNLAFPTCERLQSEIEQLVWHQEEPFGSTSIFAQWCVMHAAHARRVTVLLDGQGADEVLAGYRPFAFFMSDLIHGHQWGRLLAEARAIAGHTDLPGTAVAPMVLAAALRQLRGPQFRALRLRRRRRRIDFSVLNPEWVRTQRAQDPSQSDWIPFSLNEHLKDQVEESSLPHLLRYEDRNSMAFSVEARVPFLDYRLVEYSFTQAADLRIRDGWTKWILRRAMETRIPPEILWRQDKVGFETPETDWLRQWMHAEPDLFSDRAHSRPYLNIPSVREKAAAWVEGKQGGPVPIWRWINLEVWLRVWSRAQ